MNNTILILISLLFLTGCMEERGVPYLQEKNGIEYEVNSEIPFTGKYVEKYENGQKKLEKHYKDGELNGLQTHWNENGQKEFEGNLENGWEEGLHTSWYENGQKFYEGNYKNGELNGRFTEWYKNGQKFYEGNLKDGKQEGLWTEWDKEGNVTKTETWKDDELVE
jgi:antitoxin component YwqK of YwqJK toxin-antitoxin module